MWMLVIGIALILVAIGIFAYALCPIIKKF